jgi:hypothetical protein
MSRQHDDRHVLVRTLLSGPHHAHEIHSVQGRHVPVADDHVGGEVPQFLEGVGPVARLELVLDAERMQDALNQGTHVLVIVEDQEI